MDIRQLTYFQEVAKHQSFSRAGDALHISQPTISKTVKSLEDELGVPLLERSTKQVRLTDAGEVVFKQALKILKDFGDLSSELSDVLNLDLGSIRIGLPPMVGASFFPEVLAGFYTRHPRISIRLIEVGAVAVTQQVEDGSLDLGAIVLPLKGNSDLDFLKLYEDRLMLVVSPNHRLAEHPEVSLNLLKDESFILYRSDFTLHHHIREQCINFGFEPKVVYESSQWDFMSKMVEANLGIALLPTTICSELHPNRIKCIPLNKPVIPWNLGLIWRKDRYLSFATREFINFTQLQLQQKRPGNS